ncbi:MAG: hypothetical protein R2939_10655 [Kofleriaceae bacterium]
MRERIVASEPQVITASSEGASLRLHVVGRHIVRARFESAHASGELEELLAAWRKDRTDPYGDIAGRYDDMVAECERLSSDRVERHAEAFCALVVEALAEKAR